MGRGSLVHVKVHRVAEVGTEVLCCGAAVASRCRPVVLVAYEVVGVHQVELLGKLAHRDLGVESDLDLAGACGLGGHHDYAVASSGTVNGRERGIFEHVDGRDVGWWDVVDIVCLESVHDIERVVALGNGGAPAHADVDVGTRGAVDSGHLDAGHLALEGHGRRSHRDGCQFGPGDGPDGSREVAAGHYTAITDDDSILQELGILFKDAIRRLLPCADGHLLLGITDTGHDDCGFCGDGKRPLAVNISHGAVGGAFHGDRSAYDRFTIDILDRSRDFLLCKRRSSCHEKGEDSEHSRS